MSKASLGAALRPPPALTTLVAHPPTWMLLESQVYLAQCKNATWARSTTSRGDTVEVSFCVDKPPAVSYMCVHSPTLTPADFTGVPSVVCSEEDLLLLLMPMAFSGKFSGKVDKEYFMYKAGSGSVHPSLRRIPTHHQRYHRSEDIGMIRDGGEYYLAALLFTSHIGEFTLHLYSSASDQWVVKSVPLDPSCNLDRAASERQPTLPHKTIRLGGSLLGWVDLWKGILTCDVLAKHPVVRFIRLPELMPGNFCHDSPELIRDVHCTGGVIKFIEMEHFLIPTVEPTQASKRPGKEANILYDSDLEPPCKDDAPDLEIWFKSFVGWRTVIWDRMVSGNCWNKVHMASYDEIMFPDPTHYEMLSELGDGSAGNLVLMNLSTASPTLSIGGDNVVHMTSTVKLDHGRSVMMTLNLQKKTVEELVLYSHEREIHHPLRPCVLSNHLKTSQGSSRIHPLARRDHYIKVCRSVQERPSPY